MVEEEESTYTVGNYILDCSSAYSTAEWVALVRML
jgi:hypothetical protein